MGTPEREKFLREQIAKWLRAPVVQGGHQIFFQDVLDILNAKDAKIRELEAQWQDHLNDAQGDAWDREVHGDR